MAGGMSAGSPRLRPALRLIDAYRDSAPGSETPSSSPDVKPRSLDAYRRPRPRMGRGVGVAAALRRPPVRGGQPGAVRGLLPPTRQPVLGRHLGCHRLSADPRGIAAQGVLPPDRHRDRRHDGGRAHGRLSAEPRRLPGRHGVLGSLLRLRGHADAQLRGLCGHAVGLHPGHHRGRRDLGARPGLHPGGRAGERDLARHRLRHTGHGPVGPRPVAGEAGRGARRHRPRDPSSRHRTPGERRRLPAGRVAPAP